MKLIRRPFSVSRSTFLLHLVELALEIVDVAGFRRRFFRLRRASAPVALAPRERREHGEGALEHFHVPPHLVLERGEGADAEGLRHLLAELLLLAGQRLDRDFEIARHQHLHAVAVEADELAQEGDRQQVLPFLVLLLENDLGEHRAGDVLAGLGVIDDEILAVLDHGGEVFERHIGARAGVVEPPVGVFLDRDRLCGLGHGFGHDGRANRASFAVKIGGFAGRGYRFVTLSAIAAAGLGTPWHASTAAPATRLAPCRGRIASL